MKDSVRSQHCKSIEDNVTETHFHPHHRERREAVITEDRPSRQPGHWGWTRQYSSELGCQAGQVGGEEEIKGQEGRCE
jgi:hypothetical protein